MCVCVCRNNRKRSAGSLSARTPFSSYSPLVLRLSSLTIASHSPAADTEFADFLAAAGLDVVGRSSSTPSPITSLVGAVPATGAEDADAQSGEEEADRRSGPFAYTGLLGRRRAQLCRPVLRHYPVLPEWRRQAAAGRRLATLRPQRHCEGA